MKERLEIGVVYGALAFDLRIADPKRKRTLATADAEALAGTIRRNLIAECADVRALRLRIGAAFYSACDLLRIGWPLHRSLLTTGKIETNASDRDGETAAAVAAEDLPEPDSCPDTRDLLSLPFVLEGPVVSAKAAARQFDRNRMLPYTPRARNPAFDLPALPAFDAVGYLSLRALSSVLSGRYYTQGLGDAWTLIERAVFDPADEHCVAMRSDVTLNGDTHKAASAPWLYYSQGRVRIASNDTHAQRCRTLFEAHGLAVTSDVDDTQA